MHPSAAQAGKPLHFAGAHCAPLRGCADGRVPSLRVLCGNLCGNVVDIGGKACLTPLVWGENGLNSPLFYLLPAGVSNCLFGLALVFRRGYRPFRGKTCRSSPGLPLICSCFAVGFCKSFFAVFQFLPATGSESPVKPTVFRFHPAPAGHNKNKCKSKSKYKGKIKCKGKSKEKKKRKPFSLKRERSGRPFFAHVHPCGKDSRVRPGRLHASPPVILSAAKNPYPRGQGNVAGRLPALQ